MRPDAKTQEGKSMNEHPDYVETYMAKVNAAKQFVINTVKEATGRAGLESVYRSEAHAAAVATDVIRKALDVLVARGMTRTEAINKVRRLNLTAEEFQRLAKSGKKQPKVRYDTNGSGSASNVEDDDDKDKADEQLNKLATAVQRAHSDARFSKAQAMTWAIDNLPEARELVRLSKRRSIGHYGEQATGHFDKAESPVSQPLPAGVAKMSDADLTSLYRDGHFDKLAGGDSRPRGQSATARTIPPPVPSVRRDPRDAADFDAGNARIADGRRTPDQGTFADRVKQLQNSGLNFDQASTRAMRERGNPDAISP
jgi:hypothetical protein